MTLEEETGREEELIMLNKVEPFFGHVFRLEQPVLKHRVENHYY